MGGATLAVTVGVVFGVYSIGGSQSPPAIPGSEAAELQDLKPADRARLIRLMEKIDADPTDTASLVRLGDIFFMAGDYATAGGWMEQAVAIEPGNIRARLALGATRFNLGDRDGARREWLQVIAIDPGNVEAYYDLGFLYLTADPPDMARAKRAWSRVVALAPDSPIAEMIEIHLEALKPGADGSESPSNGADSPAPGPGER